uniref:Integrase catalytic domain-containing protein n=1 Tax=Monopterus albus TaxID=43700 RepID=A0A3Q3IDU7_MONAL
MWTAKDITKYFVTTCETCNQFNPRAAMKAGLGGFPVPDVPWKEIVVDFTDMGADKRVERKQYLLVCVDPFSKWVEAVPTKTKTGKEVKWLTREVIPQFGVPEIIRSDNGTHFSNDDLRLVERMFGIKHKFGAVYHAASQGLVEHANRTIKEGLTKVCADTNLTWVEALPIVSFNLRSIPNATLNVSPHEILTGRKMPCPLTVMPRDSTLLLLQHANMNDVSEQVIEILHRDQPEEPTPVAVDSWVYQKVHKLHWSEPRWKDPYKVAETTTHCVKLWLTENMLSNWIHKTHYSPAEDPAGWTVNEVRADLRTSVPELIYNPAEPEPQLEEDLP